MVSGIQRRQFCFVDDWYPYSVNLVLPQILKQTDQALKQDCRGLTLTLERTSNFLRQYWEFFLLLSPGETRSRLSYDYSRVSRRERDFILLFSCFETSSRKSFPVVEREKMKLTLVENSRRPLKNLILWLFFILPWGSDFLHSYECTVQPSELPILRPLHLYSEKNILRARVWRRGMWRRKCGQLSVSTFYNKICAWSYVWNWGGERRNCGQKSIFK